jgi:hypothetical protein
MTTLIFVSDAAKVVGRNRGTGGGSLASPVLSYPTDNSMGRPTPLGTPDRVKSSAPNRTNQIETKVILLVADDHALTRGGTCALLALVNYALSGVSRAAVAAADFCWLRFAIA